MGNALKTLSMRLRSTAVQMEEAGEESDGLSESLSKNRETIKALSGVDIMQDKNTYKSTFQIMREIANIWNEMSDVNQAGLLEVLAGKTRANQVSALLSNWKQVEKAFISANNSSGSATAENDKYVRSIEGRMNTLKATSQEMATSVFDSDNVNQMVKGLNQILNFVNKLIKKFGSLGTIVGTTGLLYGLRGKQFGNLGFTKDNILQYWAFFTKKTEQGVTKINALFSNLLNSKNIINNPNRLIGYNDNLFMSSVLDTNSLTDKIKYYNENVFGKGEEQVKTYQTTLSQTNSLINKYLQQQIVLGQKASQSDYVTYLQKYGSINTKGLSGLINVLGKFNSLSTGGEKFNENQQNFLNTLSVMNPKMADTIKSVGETTKKTTVGFGQYTLALVKAKASTVTLTVASGVLNSIISMGLGMIAGSILNSVINFFASLDKMSDSVLDAIQNFQSFNNEISEYKTNLEELKKVQDKAVDKSELIETNKELITLQNELFSTYGKQANGIDLVNGKYEEQIKTLDTLNKKTSEQYLQENTKEIKKAQSKLGFSEFDSNSILFDFTKNNFSGLDTDVYNVFKQNGFNMDYGNNSNVTIKFKLDFDKGQSIVDERNKLQSLYDDIKTYGEQTGKDVSGILNQVQVRISNLSTEKIEDAINVYDTFLQTVVNTNETIFGEKTLKEWQNGASDLINQYNDYLVNGDLTNAKKTYEEIQEYYNNMKALIEGANSLKTAQGIKATGVEDYLTKSLEDFLNGNLDANKIKIKLEDLLDEDSLKDEVKQLAKTTRDELILALQTGDFSKVGLLDGGFLTGLLDEYGVSIEELVGYLVELGYVQENTKDKTLEITNAISKSGEVVDTTAEALGNSHEKVKNLADEIEIINKAISDMSDGSISNDSVFALIKNGFGSAVSYDSNANVFTMDTQKLRELVKAKYEDIEATNKQNIAELERAKQHDLNTINNTTNPDDKKILQDRFDEQNYDEQIRNAYASLYAVQRNYQNTLKSINPYNVASQQVKSLEEQFSTVSGMYSKLLNGEVLSNSDINTILGSDFAQSLEFDDESNQVTINTQKYQELAKAKIQAYSVDLTKNNEQLSKEVDYLQEHINELRVVSGFGDTANNSYISREIVETTEKLQETKSAIAENEKALDNLETLGGRVGSIFNGGFDDILEKTKDIESSTSTMSNAFKEVRENGSLSINTMMNLIDSGYGSTLQIDKNTNSVKINANAYKELATQQIDYQIATLKAQQSTGNNTRQIQQQIQALQLLKTQLGSVASGYYGENLHSVKADAQFNQLEHLHNMNVISEEEYYNAMDKLNKKYYANRIEYLDQYRKYEEQIYQYQQEQRTKSLEKQKKVLEEQKNILDEQKEAWNDSKDIIEKQIKSIEKEKDTIQDSIDAIEEQKDYWNEQKDILDEQKEAIQEQIDAINEKNEEEERALKIQEAQLKLQNALNQKNVRTFTDELGWHWTANQKDVKDAQDELNELLKEDETAELEKQIKAIEQQEKEIDKEINALDKQIDVLEKEQKQLDKQIDVLQDQQDAIDEQIDALEEQEKVLDKQISALDKQIEKIENDTSLNSSHVDELTGKTNGSTFKELSEKAINKLLGLPEDFSTFTTSNFSQPMKDLKTSIDTAQSSLADITKQNNISPFARNNQVATTTTFNIDKIVSNDAFDFVGQINSLLQKQIK